MKSSNKEVKLELLLEESLFTNSLCKRNINRISHILEDFSTAELTVVRYLEYHFKLHIYMYPFSFF